MFSRARRFDYDTRPITPILSQQKKTPRTKQQSSTNSVPRNKSQKTNRRKQSSHIQNVNGTLQENIAEKSTQMEMEKVELGMGKIQVSTPKHYESERIKQKLLNFQECSEKLKKIYDQYVMNDNQLEKLSNQINIVQRNLTEHIENTVNEVFKQTRIIST